MTSDQKTVFRTTITASDGRTLRADDGLAEKVAIVTGAAAGIGRATVARLLASGCRVVAVDADRPALEAAPGELAGGNNLLTVVADVGSEAGCLAYVDAAVRQFGRIDLFVNNAGIIGPKSPIVETPIEALDRIYAVNIRGVFAGMKAVLIQMIRQKTGGSIVNLASISGIAPTRTSPAGYAASKAAVISLTKSAAAESGMHGVRVNAVAPGAVNTAMVSDASRQPGTTAFARQPVSRIAQPEEIADLIAYLLSDRAAFQTGGVYTADGGAMLG
ncbi:MAG TPA: SDR family oxidoreductase [Devosia sp.]|nr:SDR family oxidoreductase [Devosia sp.]